MDIKAELDSVQGFVDRGNFHAAYNIALSGMNECRRSENQDGVNEFIDAIKGIANSLAEKFGRPSSLDENPYVDKQSE